MMFWGYGYNGFMMLGMVLGNLLWLVLLGLLIWVSIRWLGRSLANNTHHPVGEPSALEILRQRYARGEIDAVTFEHMKERLEGTMEQPVGHV
jgi:putative membrane protein